MKPIMKNKLIVITGCSGGGKSTIIESLAKLGYSAISEAGRMIVKEELQKDNGALPWTDEIAFCNLLIKRSIAFFKKAQAMQHAKDNIIFFDRSFLDAISFYQTNVTDNNHQYDNLIKEFRFDNPIFITPPWQEIYKQDNERKHLFETGVAEYERLKIFYPKYGYNIIDIPKNNVENRIDFILSHI